MRRLLARTGAAALATAIAVAPSIGARAAIPAAPDDAIASGAGLAAAAVAVANVDPDFDIWPLYSESSFDNQSSHGLSGAIWPGFLLDAFAWLYGLQPQERGGFGISESQWPNPPHESKGSSSGFMMKNFAEGCAGFFSPDDCAQAFDAFGEPPGALGMSESRSGELASSGASRGVRFDFPGVLEATEGRSQTNARFERGRSVVESVFTAHDITIGENLHIELIEARSVANAGGNRQRSDGASTLRVVGARFGNTPVVIDSQGMHAAGDGGTDDLNDALAAEGLEVRLSQGRQTEDETGEFVDTATGGLLVHVLRERAEEAFPEPLITGKNAMCRSIETNDLNQEITRIRFDQPNPLFGQVPVPGMPERAQLEQSAPPTASCPFFNRNFEVTLVLGLTNASARLSPLPASDDLGADLGLPATIGDALTIRRVIVEDSGVPAQVGGTTLKVVPSVGLASAEVVDTNLPRRVKILYGLFALLLLLGIGGRFALRALSAP